MKIFHGAKHFDGKGGMTVGVEAIYEHEQFTRSTLINDIALIKLKGQVYNFLMYLLNVCRMAQLVIQRAGSYGKIHTTFIKFIMPLFTILYLLVVELFF
jgi:hypothetical protein